MTDPASETVARFRAEHPGEFFLAASEREALGAYLSSRGVLGAAETVQETARAGDGNMNCTVRVTTSQRSFIVKQSRPWVEKYPQFAAPRDRACREAEFYQLISARLEVARVMPRILHFDATARLLVLEDLGAASDYTGVYRGGSFTGEEIGKLARFLRSLHEIREQEEGGTSLPNREMRALNHDHIFRIPLMAQNGLDLDQLTPGLAEVARSLQADADYVRTVADLGREVYLADGPALLHGDFFPGSLLRTAEGPRVIDPEFGYFGRPEFDAAIFLAHLLLANQKAEQITCWQREYGNPPNFEESLMLRLAGVEIMRRLIGYAQLPLGYGLDRKRELLELSRALVLNPSRAALPGNPTRSHA